MKIRLTEGLNKISIGFNAMGSYLYFKKPIVTSWYDDYRTLGKFLCLLPYNEEYRNEVRNRILSELNNNYTNKSLELLEVLTPIIKLFVNGEYDIDYYHSSDNRYLAYQGSTTSRRPWSLVFSESMRLHDTE